MQKETSHLKQREKEFFDHKYYNFLNQHVHNISFFRNYASKTFDKFLKFIPPECISNKSILDIGCNDGRYLGYFHNVGSKFTVGMDLSFHAMKRGKTQNLIPVDNKLIPSDKNLVVQSDIEQPTFKNNSFDTIFCIRSLHHFNLKNEFISNCHDLLRKHGFLILIDPNGSNPFRKFGDFIGRKYGIMSSDEQSKDIFEIIAFLKNHSFNIISVNYFNILSEPILQISEIMINKNKSLFHMLTLFLFISYQFEFLFEKIILKLYPKMSWSYILIAQKN